MIYSKKVIKLIIGCLIAISCLPTTIAHANTGGIISSEAQEHILSELRSAQFPNAAIAIIQNDDVSYIFKNSTQNDLFQIGSVSKSFTGFGILFLEDEGLLSVNDPVKKHLPWFEVYYQGVPVPPEDITIGNLLHHTSGFTSNERIFPSSIRMRTTDEFIAQLIGVELAFYPSTQFVYGNINYIILGFIIESVSGQSYNEFMTQNILHPLGLYDTFTSVQHAHETGRAVGGNRLGFLRARPWNVAMPPLAIPTGYIYSSIRDMGRWAQIHMGTVYLSEQFQRIVQRSHVYGHFETPFFDEHHFYHGNYGAGWIINLDNGSIQHAGQTPGYSAMVLMFPYRSTAVVILGNLPHGSINRVAAFVLDTITGKPFYAMPANMFMGLDLNNTIITAIGGIASLLFALFVIRLVRQMRNGYKIGFKITFKNIALFIIPLILSIVAIGWFILIPVLFHNSFAFLMMFSPASGTFASISIIAMTVYAWCFWLAKILINTAPAPALGVKH